MRACRLQGDLVFLDIRNDAYFCLPAATTVADLSEDARHLRLQDADFASELAAAGFLEAGPQSAPIVDRTAPPARRSALPDIPEPIRLQDLPQMARCLLDLALHYRNRSFEQLVSRAAKPAPPRRRAARPPLEDLLRRFHR